ncbi:uncharacterized protein [Aristolochia californica]|uniref:uncharacterized protein n=1 Tax=Aristolochia californica TaxID=171875 RepID=UPI0035E20D83
MAPTVEKLYRYLCSVRDLYQSAHECLQMQNTQQVHHKNRVEEELDESLRLLDVIGMTRDVMAEMKSFRKKMKRQIVKHIKDLKTNAVKSTSCSHTSVANALTEATSVTLTFLESLLSIFFSRSVTRRKPPVSKWMGTGRVASKGEAETMNEMAGVEAYLSSLRGHKSPKHKGIEEAKYAQKQLEALEVSIRPV